MFLLCFQDGTGRFSMAGTEFLKIQQDISLCGQISTILAGQQETTR